MKRSFEQYVDNVNKLNSLARPRINKEMSNEDILKLIHSLSERIFELKSRNDSILRENILSSEPEKLSSSDADELFELAEELYGGGNGPDVGTAYEIHRILYDHAVFKNDRDLIIRELFYLGVTLNSLHLLVKDHNINTCGQMIHDYFAAGAEYFKYYDLIESEKTRSYIICCIGNLKNGLPSIDGDGDWNRKPDYIKSYIEYSRCFDLAMDTIRSERLRSMNPSIRWNAFETVLHTDRTSYLSALRDISLVDQEIYKVISRDVLESAEYALGTIKYTDPMTSSRTEYVYRAAKFHAGKMSARDLIEPILARAEKADMSDFSPNGVLENIGLVTYANKYIRYLSDSEKEEIIPRFRKAALHGLDYLTVYPKSSFGEGIGVYVTELVKDQLSGGNIVRTGLVNLLLHTHAPTYVHSMMVGSLARRLFLEAVEKNPDYLGGVFGATSKEELKEKAEEFAGRAFLCGLYHDAGKNQVLPFITIYSRRLSDIEFNAIKYHTVLGYFLLSEFSGLDIEAEVALRHHLWYNNKGGYPDRCRGDSSEAARAITDIVSVADSLDAGTDNIGRSYAVSKSFDVLVDELRAGSGTRYCPEVVALFEDKEFYNDLKSKISEFRKNAYCMTYQAIARYSPKIDEEKER